MEAGAVVHTVIVEGRERCRLACHGHHSVIAACQGTADPAFLSGMWMTSLLVMHACMSSMHINNQNRSLFGCFAGQDSLAEPEQVAQHDYMLVDFALGLLHASLKKGTLGGLSPAALALLDPMLPLLIRALRSRHANSVSLALKCLAFLIRMPLPGTQHVSFFDQTLLS